MEYISVIAGLVLLVVCGDVLIRGSVSVAENFGVSKLVIGLTVIAFGTSAPELVVGVNAALNGVPTMALGNVVGSNTANILLVIGVPAIMYPFICDSSEVKRNFNIMLAGSIIFVMLCFSAPLGKVHAIFLLIFLFAFLISSYKNGKVDPIKKADSQELSDKAYEDFEELPEEPLSNPRSAIYVIAGLAGLIYGAQILVDGGVIIAQSFGVSEAVIGLTIIAIGTSLPELVTAIMAARQNHGDVALGNIIGSNIFNLYAIMGATSLVADVPVPDSFLTIDLWVMLASSAALLPFILWKIRFNRVLGIIFTVGYVVYLYTLGAA